jgi:hypothetical protein
MRSGGCTVALVVHERPVVVVAFMSYLPPWEPDDVFAGRHAAPRAYGFDADEAEVQVLDAGFEMTTGWQWTGSAWGAVIRQRRVSSCCRSAAIPRGRTTRWAACMQCGQPCDTVPSSIQLLQIRSWHAGKESPVRKPVSERLLERLRNEGIIPAGQAVGIRRTHASGSMRVSGAWSWYASWGDHRPGQTVGSQWPMAACLTAAQLESSRNKFGEVSIDPKTPDGKYVQVKRR